MKREYGVNRKWRDNELVVMISAAVKTVMREGGSNINELIIAYASLP
jgi:hypothetical protein